MTDKTYARSVYLMLCLSLGATTGVALRYPAAGVLLGLVALIFVVYLQSDDDR